MKRNFLAIIIAAFLLVLCTSAIATNYYCQWSWPQKITNQDTGAVLFTCPSSQPYCKSGTTQCCKWTSDLGHYECIDSGIGASEPVSTEPVSTTPTTTTSTTTTPTTTTIPTTSITPTTTTISDTATIGTVSSTPTVAPVTDLCASIRCADRTETCPDGYVAKCTKQCDPSTGTCLSCTPDCSSHQLAAATPVVPAVQPKISTLPKTTMPVESSKIISEEPKESEILDIPKSPAIPSLPSAPASQAPPVSESKAPAGMPPAGSNDEKKLNQLLAAHDISIKDVAKVEIRQTGTALETVQQTKLFGLFAVDMKVSSVYDTGNLLISSDKPWWNIFGWGKPSPNKPEPSRENVTYYCCNEPGAWIKEKCGWVHRESHCAVSQGMGKSMTNTCKDKCAEIGMQGLMLGSGDGMNADSRCECYYVAPEAPEEEEEEVPAVPSSYYCCGPDEENLALKPECDTIKHEWKVRIPSGVEVPACWTIRCEDYCSSKGFKYGFISDDNLQCKCLPAEENKPQKLELSCCREAVEGPEKFTWVARNNCPDEPIGWASVHDSTLFSCGDKKCDEYCAEFGFTTGFVDSAHDEKCVCSTLEDNKKFYCCGPSTNQLSVKDVCNQNKYEWKKWSTAPAPACWNTNCETYCAGLGYKKGEASADKKECICSLQPEAGKFYCCGPDGQHVSVSDACSQTKFEWKTWDGTNVEGPACWMTKCSDYCMSKGFKSGSLSADSKECLCSQEAAAGKYYCCGKNEDSAKPADSCADNKYAWNMHAAAGNKFCGPANTFSCESQCFHGNFYFNSDKTECVCANPIPEANGGDIYYCCDGKWQYNACSSSAEASCSAAGSCKDYCAAMDMEGVMEGTASGNVNDRYRCRCKPVPIDTSVSYCCGKDQQHASVRSACFYNKYDWKTWDGSGIEGDSCWKTNCETMCIAKGNLTGTVSADKKKCICSGIFDLAAIQYETPKYYCLADGKWSSTPGYAHQESFCLNTDDACTSKCSRVNGMLGKMAGSAEGQGNDRYRCECYGTAIYFNSPKDAEQLKCCVDHPAKPSDFRYGRVWWPTNKDCPNNMQRADTSFCQNSLITGACANLCYTGKVNSTDCICPYNLNISWRLIPGSVEYSGKDIDTGRTDFGRLYGAKAWIYAKANVNVWSLSHLLKDSQVSKLRAYHAQKIDIEGPLGKVRLLNVTLKVRYAGVIDESNTGVNPALLSGIAGVYSAKVHAGIKRGNIATINNPSARTKLWESEYTAGQFFFDTVSDAIKNAVISLIMPEMDEVTETAMDVSDALIAQAQSADSCTDSVDETKYVTFTNLAVKPGDEIWGFVSLEGQTVEAAIGALGVGFTEIDFMNKKPNACDHKGKDIPQRGVYVEEVSAVWAN